MLGNSCCHHYFILRCFSLVYGCWRSANLCNIPSCSCTGPCYHASDVRGVRLNTTYSWHTVSPLPAFVVLILGIVVFQYLPASSQRVGYIADPGSQTRHRPLPPRQVRAYAIISRARYTTPFVRPNSSGFRVLTTSAFH